MERSFNGILRGRSEVLLQVAPRLLTLAAAVQTEDIRELERLLRFGRDLDSRMQKRLPRATVKVPTESEQRHERERVRELRSRRARYYRANGLRLPGGERGLR